MVANGPTSSFERDRQHNIYKTPDTSSLSEASPESVRSMLIEHLRQTNPLLANELLVEGHVANLISAVPNIRRVSSSTVFREAANDTAMRLIA